MNHILLEGHNATCDDFSIPIPENNYFKLQLKESLLIKRAQQKHLHPALIRAFLPHDISYCNVFLFFFCFFFFFFFFFFFCIIRIIVLLTRSCYYENLNNSSSL